LQVQGNLGNGASGTVEKVSSNWSGKFYALKLIRRTTKDDTKRAEDELNMLKRVKHEHIVTLIGSFTEPGYFGLLMSPVAECNLTKFFDSTLAGPDEKSLLRTFFGCLANTIYYLHYEANIKHKDIKPENILVQRGGVFVTDFGISHDWSETLRTTTWGPTAKTPMYCAPEVTDEEKSRRSSSDIWSLGCVFLEMVTVLQGNSVQEMRTYLNRNGSGSRIYHRNLEAVSQWITRLGESGSQLEKEPLDWIRDMLKPEEGQRPNANALKRRILSFNSNSPLSFSGFCCRELGE